MLEHLLRYRRPESTSNHGCIKMVPLSLSTSHIVICTKVSVLCALYENKDVKHTEGFLDRTLCFSVK